MQAKEIFKLIEKDFLKKLACKWDPTGYQYGKPATQVNKILVALDLTTTVIKKAIAENVNLIITHHPFVFNKLKQEKQDVTKKTIFQLLDQHQIVVYATHTNYDSQLSTGMNSLILQNLGCQNITNLTHNNVAKQGRLPAPLSYQDIITKLKNIFQIPVVQHIINDLTTKISTIAICTGAGGSVIHGLTDKIDLFITGEVKWNEWLKFNEQQIPVACFNHYMEDYYTNHFSEYLKGILPKTIDIIPFHIKNIINYY